MRRREVNASPFISAAAASPDEGTLSSLFPAEMPVSYDAAGQVVSRYGSPFWNMSSMSSDGTTAATLYFYEVDGASSSDLSSRIREQQKALIWMYMDAGKTRALATVKLANFSLNIWCDKAAEKGVDLYTLLTNQDLVTDVAPGLNQCYLDMTPALLHTLWRHRLQLNAPAAFPFQMLRDALQMQSRSRPDAKQTPLIPSRVYCTILTALSDRLALIETELEVLLDAYAQCKAASRNGPKNATQTQVLYFRTKQLADVAQRMRELGYEATQGVTLDGFVATRIVEHQLALMLAVVAFSGMRAGEVSILPLEDVLAEFEHRGSTHYELQGYTLKLNSGVKHATTWITSHLGARAVRLAQRIARVIKQQYEEPAKIGQQALLFPTTKNPYRRLSGERLHRSSIRMRELLCPVIEQPDIEELDRLELARGWARDDIVVGKRWPLAFHQLRRSLAVYAHRSGMVSLPALKAQLQHITQEMTAYYSDGFSKAVNLVFDKKHFSHEWKAAEAESSFFAYVLGVLLSDEELLGQGVLRMADTVESRSRQETFRLFEQNKLAYRETPLGGCISTEVCKIDPLEPIPYHCLETNCVSLVVVGKRLDHIIKYQQVAVASLKRDEAGSVEYRLEARHLEVLLKARDRLRRGTS